MSVADANQAYSNLDPAAQQDFLAQQGLTLDKPSPQANDRVWFMVIATLAVALLGALGALALFVYDGRSTDLFSPIVTLVLGIFGGLLAPSPAKTTTAQAG